jgi:hypothetical protein
MLSVDLLVVTLLELSSRYTSEGVYSYDVGGADDSSDSIVEGIVIVVVVW